MEYWLQAPPQPIIIQYVGPMGPLLLVKKILSAILNQ